MSPVIVAVDATKPAVMDCPAVAVDSALAGSSSSSGRARLRVRAGPSQ